MLSNIPDATSASFLPIPFAIGVLLHLALFTRGEWDLRMPRILGLFIMAQVSVIAFLRISNKGHDSNALRNAFWAVSLQGTSLIAGIISSLTIYRLYFHRLNIFPGSKWARFSNFYAAGLSSDLRFYEKVQKLHKDNGDFVRIGPSELSITDPNAIKAILSAQSPCVKGPWYNLLHPRVSLQMTRDRKEHARRRKVWDRGFSVKALRAYEHRVAKYTDSLLAHIASTTSKPVNMSHWFNYYSFDVMGEMAFGKSFNMLRDGVSHYFLKCVHSNMLFVGYLSHLPWLFPFFRITPVLNADNLKFQKWLGNQVDERMAMKTSDHPDVFSWILEDYNTHPQGPQARLNLEADAELIVVAGSDTTAASLTCLFYELARDSALLIPLREEIDPYFADVKEKGGEIDGIGLSKLKHLDAAITEGLRLHPPVPGGVQRMTPKEGMQIAERWVPGNVIVQVPVYTVCRDERNFKEPNSFIPERWTTRSDMVINASVNVPFSAGTDACVGKNLALLEMRFVVARIVHKYDVKFAPGQTPEKFLGAMKDTFTLSLGELVLVFTERAKGTK